MTLLLKKKTEGTAWNSIFLSKCTLTPCGFKTPNKNNLILILKTYNFFSNEKTHRLLKSYIFNETNGQ